MKKLFYFLTVFSLVFTSCDPLEDINTEIDSQQSKNKAIGDLTYTLTDKDYTESVEDGGLELSNEYLNSVDDAKEKLPAFLANKYPSLGVIYKEDGSIDKASSVTITYNLDNAIKKETYTAVDADYTAISLTSLDSDADISKMLEHKFPNQDNGTVVTLTYKTGPEITKYELVDADYALVGNGRFNNFDIRVGKADETVEARRIKIQTILLNNYPNATVGTIYEVSYKTYDGTAAGTDTMQVVLTENQPANVTDYELINADYTLVGNGQYNNFDIRAGKSEETEESRRVKIETILLNNFANATSGDIYKVTYAIYDGAAGTREMLVQFDGTNWNIFKALTYDAYTFALVDATNVFTFVDGWQIPFTLELADYQAMGSRFANLTARTDDELAEAKRKVGVFLDGKFNFAAADDFKAVQFAIYNGSGTENVNFNYIFDGTNWKVVPAVVTETLQFGHDGAKWVPDNTIKYTLTNADYALVGNGRFNNFDVREGKAEEKEDDRRKKISTILLNNFPQYGEGQKFSVSYNVWKPGDDVFVMNVIHNGTEYILK